MKYGMCIFVRAARNNAFLFNAINPPTDNSFAGLGRVRTVKYFLLYKEPMPSLSIRAGVVVAARDRIDGVNVAIKKITNSIQDESSAKQVLLGVGLHGMLFSLPGQI